MPRLLLLPWLFCSALAALFVVNGFTMPRGLELAATTEIVATASRSRENRRDVVLLDAGEQRFTVTCPTVPELCAATAEREVHDLRALVADAGWFGGTWIVEASDGTQTWVTRADQHAQFTVMRRFYTTLAAVFVLIAAALTYLVFRPRRRRTA